MTCTTRRWLFGLLFAATLGQRGSDLRADQRRQSLDQVPQLRSAKSGAGLIKTGFKIVDTCHGNRDKGKFAGNCNALAEADLKGAFTKAEDKSFTTFGKKCLAGDVVRANYAGR